MTDAGLRVAPHDERPLVDERIAEIKADLDAENYRGAAAALRRAVRVPQEPTAVRRFAALVSRLPPDAVEWRRRCRIAILSASTLADRPALLRLQLAADLIGADVYEGPFDLVEEEVLDPQSGYNRFGPDVTVLAPTSHASAHFEEKSPDLDLARWTRLWSAIQARHRGRVIQHGLEVLPDPVLGNLELTLAESDGRRIRQFNLDLAAAATPGVSVLDVDALAAALGRDAWSDPRFWFLAKESTTIAGRVALARAEAALIRGCLGLAKKVIAVDLDDTLWGGAIGEDGVDGVRLGGDAAGNAFVAFQRYLKALRARGVLLALVSKNEEEAVREAFERHPEMILEWNDFAAVRVNWQAKSANLEEIAAELSLGLDAFLYVDDEPAERAEVRAALPEVDVVCMPRDPCSFVRAVAEGRWFDVPTLNDQDRARAEDYRAARASRRLLTSAPTLDAFLASLDLRAEIAPFDELNLPRIVQLIQRTNQFNLTARRYTDAEVAELAAATGVHAFFLRLRDRFADRGIVAVLIARETGDALEIDTLLVSCRVLGRTVEQALLAHVLDLGTRLGKTRILGRYVATARNSMVKELYTQLGFTRIEEDGRGNSQWERRLGEPAPRSLIAIETDRSPTASALRPQEERA